MYQARKVRRHISTMYVLGVSILPLSAIFLLDFRTVTKMWFFSFILACFDGRENNHHLFFTAFSDFEFQILEISGKCERYLWSHQ